MDKSVYAFNNYLLPMLVGNIQVVPTELLNEDNLVKDFSLGNNNNSYNMSYWVVADEVPKHNVGDIILSLNPEFSNPEENSLWVDWESVILSNYPELEALVQSFYHRRDCENDFEREFWEYAVTHNCLPSLRDIFISINSNTVGSINKGKPGGLNYSMPIVEYMEGFLKPVGYSQDDIPKPVFYSNVDKGNSHKTDLKSDLVILAQRSQLHKTCECPTLVENGCHPIGYPTNIALKLKICTQTHYIGVPLTHTPIKCIESHYLV